MKNKYTIQLIFILLIILSLSQNQKCQPNYTLTNIQKGFLKFTSLILPFQNNSKNLISNFQSFNYTFANDFTSIPSISFAISEFEFENLKYPSFYISKSNKSQKNNLKNVQFILILYSSWNAFGINFIITDRQQLILGNSVMITIWDSKKIIYGIQMNTGKYYRRSIARIFLNGILFKSPQTQFNQTINNTKYIPLSLSYNSITGSSLMLNINANAQILSLIGSIWISFIIFAPNQLSFASYGGLITKNNFKGKQYEDLHKLIYKSQYMIYGINNIELGQISNNKSILFKATIQQDLMLIMQTNENIPQISLTYVIFGNKPNNVCNMNKYCNNLTSNLSSFSTQKPIWYSIYKSECVPINDFPKPCFIPQTYPFLYPDNSVSCLKCNQQFLNLKISQNIQQVDNIMQCVCKDGYMLKNANEINKGCVKIDDKNNIKIKIIQKQKLPAAYDILNQTEININTNTNTSTNININTNTNTNNTTTIQNKQSSRSNSSLFNTQQALTTNNNSLSQIISPSLTNIINNQSFNSSSQSYKQKCLQQIKNSYFDGIQCRCKVGYRISNNLKNINNISCQQISQNNEYLNQVSYRLQDKIQINSQNLTVNNNTNNIIVNNSKLNSNENHLIPTICLLQNNQVYNLVTQSCDCIIGFYRSNNQICKQCIQPFHLSNGKCIERCGDGYVTINQQCDDKNSNNNDGCSNKCLIQNDFKCNGQPSLCTYIGKQIRCGNRIIQLDSGQKCDDGNLINNDGCSSICQIETGYICFSQPSICKINLTNNLCGNGFIQFSQFCDDANILQNDGCSRFCKVQQGYICSGQPSICHKKQTINNDLPLKLYSQISFNRINIFLSLQTTQKFIFSNQNQMQNFLQSSFRTIQQPTKFCRQRQLPDLDIHDCLIIYPSGIPNKIFQGTFWYNYQGNQGRLTLKINPLSANIIKNLRKL